MQRLDPEGRVRAHVQGRPVPTTAVLGDARVDPLPGKQQPWARSAGSPSGTRGPGPRPCPVTTSPSRTNRRPEGRARPREVARPRAPRGSRWRTRSARPSSTSGTASARQPERRRHTSGGSAIVPRALKPNVKLSPIAACTAWTPRDEHVADERLGGQQREVPVERQHDEDVDAAGGDQRRPCARPWSAAVARSRAQDLARVPVEGDRDRADTPLAGPPTTVSKTARWPRWTPSKNPTVATDGSSASGSDRIPRTTSTAAERIRLARPSRPVATSVGFDPWRTCEATTRRGDVRRLADGNQRRVLSHRRRRSS